MMENKVDLSGFLHKPEDYSHIDIMGEAMRNALNRVAELNEKTAEQVVILKQQEKINLLKRQNDEMVARVARLEQVQLNALEYIGSLDATPMTIKLHDLVAEGENETPAQSLQHIRA